MSATSAAGSAAVDLYWLPLGAGAALPTVRWSGRIYEAAAAMRARRPARPIFHAALQIHLAATRYVVEMAPAWGPTSGGVGVVGLGPVGLRGLGRWRLFRYEVRRWPDGVIPDLAASVGGPRRVSSDAGRARAALAAVAEFPTATWGRDELGTGDMWNSNSLIAFTLTRAEMDTAALVPPGDGRAPGWLAGVVAANR